MTTFQILWRERDTRAWHLDEVYAYDRHNAVAAALRRHPTALSVRVL